MVSALLGAVRAGISACTVVQGGSDKNTRRKFTRGEGGGGGGGGGDGGREGHLGSVKRNGKFWTLDVAGDRRIASLSSCGFTCIRKPELAATSRICVGGLLW